MTRESGAKMLFLLYLTTVVLLTVLPLNTRGELNHAVAFRFRADHILHCLMFIPLIPLATLPGADWNHLSDWLIVPALLFAAGMEGLQYFLPYRAFNIHDVFANCIGLLLGGILAYLLEKIKRSFEGSHY